MTAKNSKPYRNTYLWYLQIKDGKTIALIAFLDIREVGLLSVEPDASVKKS